MTGRNTAAQPNGLMDRLPVAVMLILGLSAALDRGGVARALGVLSLRDACGEWLRAVRSLLANEPPSLDELTLRLAWTVWRLVGAVLFLLALFPAAVYLVLVFMDRFGLSAFLLSASALVSTLAVVTSLVCAAPAGALAWFLRSPARADVVWFAVVVISWLPFVASAA